jgi:acyl-CoA synthetase (AMP-forming)/AMP-acid ligase II
VLGYLACVTHGAAIVFPAECFDPVATLRAVQEERCTALHGVPTMFISELELLESGAIPYEGFENLRTGIAAGSSVPLELMKKLHKMLNLTDLSMCPPSRISGRGNGRLTLRLGTSDLLWVRFHFCFLDSPRRTGVD